MFFKLENVQFYETAKFIIYKSHTSIFPVTGLTAKQYTH